MSSLFHDIKTFNVVNSVNGCAANKIRYRLYVKLNTGRTFFTFTKKTDAFEYTLFIDFVILYYSH